MKTIDLNGLWELYREKSKEALSATVPGCVYTDLLAAGQIEDPYYRDNELRTLWICETDWTYARSFTVPAGFLNHDRVLLRCEGLDTLATVKVNGKAVGRADNMFRTWEFDVEEAVCEGENTIEVQFDAPLPYVRKREAEFPLPAWGVGQHKLNGGGWIRKEPCNFGWDWGPMLTTCGIWRHIGLVAFHTARLADVHILQDHSVRGRVGLRVRAGVERKGRQRLTAAFRVSHKGEVVAEQTVAFSGKTAEVDLMIRNPELWWPNGMGDQPLYRVDVALRNAEGIGLDSTSRRIGLRTLRLERKPDRWGESFHFSANGIPFFAKGANWIPADTFATRLTRDDYVRLLKDAALAHMNMLRVWGGGIYEPDVFYDLCDELGICIWQDFVFSCATYPGFDAAFRENVQAEAEDNVRRLRHHSCLALWCGNNELEQGLVGDAWTARTMNWEDYKVLFDDLLPGVVKRLDPERDYWPCSPHSPKGDRRDFNNPDCGDAHLWSVWHGKQPFEWYRTCTHRFNSEFGFQSFPEPRTVYGYTLPEDRNITSYVMEHHQRSGIGNSTIIHYMLDWFRLPTSFEMTLWLSQILQGMAIKYAVEHWRRGMPRGMGTLYWQLNDCWPVASWASIDSLGRWKALHYMAARFYAPLLISGLEDGEKGTVEVHVTSDCMDACEGKVLWRLTDAGGKALDSGSRDVRVPARKNVRVQTLKLKPYLESHGARNLALWLELRVGRKIVSTNFVTFARPKHLELADPKIAATVKALAGNRYRVTLTARKPALWAWVELLDTDAEFSDNFVHLLPDRPVDITVSPAEEMKLRDFRKRLTIHSLWDTYR